MRKFFLIPLMTLVCSVMAWGTEIVVNDFATLKAQLSASGTADVVKLAKDIAYPSNGGSDLLDIQRSLTLDGNGYKLSGYAVRGAHTGQGDNGQYNKVTLVINHQAAHSGLTVTLKNVEITENLTYTSHTVGVFVYDGVDSLAIVDNSILREPGNASNATPLAIYGESATPLKILVRDSKVLAGESSYGTVVLKPIKAYIENSTFSGYSAMTFKMPLGLYPGNRWTKGFGTANIGARGSVINATNSNFEAPNVHSGFSNGFGTFVFEEDGVDLNFTNCGFNAQALGNATQALFLLNGWYVHKSHETVDINVTISGDNSHVNGLFIDNAFYACIPVNADGVNQSGYGYENGWMGNAGYVESQKYVSSEINVTVKGGTYSINPETYTFDAHLDTSDPTYANDPRSDYAASIAKITKGFTIPDDYEVKTVTMEGVATPLYRVVKRAARDGEDKLYDLNDNVQSQGDGQNPTTSFDLSTGEDMTLNQEITKAGYVEVKDNATAGATTVTVGTPTEGQTLVINNGLDVQGNSKVDVQAGSTLVIGEGGIVTSNPENIVIEADRAGAASLIMDPAITVNQTPNLTVRMTAKQIGKTLDGEFWHRFAMPVQHADSWDKEGSLGTGNDKYPTFLYGWNYSTDSWYKLPGGVSDMQAFMGYTLRLATEEIAATDELQDVVYIFKGQLAGNTNNTLQFSRNGYNFFGNSYTGYIDLKQLVAQITGDSKIEGTAWVWNTDLQRYQDVPLNLLAAGTYDGESDKWKTEIAPMQTFILKQNGSNNASTEINYASAVWGNPRYSAATGVVAAPARRVADMNTTRMYIAVTAANGQSDEVFFVEDANYSDAFDNGYDASKYMNPNTINVFANQNGIDLGTVASDNLNGKTLSLKTNGELAYTMSFKNVEGEEYAIRDNATGAVINIEEGATYEFAAQPNSTIEGRFEIVAAAKIPTAIDNTEVKANVKGIYTIMGQYLGENFDILPAGVYVVNGVKIVK